MSRSVDCEQCENFTGRNGWARVEWGCAKGHQPESAIVLIRSEGCKDHKQASRDELIFRRFKGSASFNGNADLKGWQARATRTANGLAKSLAEFGDLMDSSQVKAGRDAVAALNRLADDIGQASALAKAFKAQEDERREAELRRQGDALADLLMPGWTEREVVECAEHLAAFDTRPAWAWLEDRHRRRMLVGSGLWAANDVAQRWKRAEAGGRAAVFGELRREVAQALQAFERPLSPEYATRQDFDAYRQFLRDRAAAKASVAALIAEASKHASGGPAD